ncbi:I78 family peptidase inhibitor [Aliiroseovarius crassostreae]|uniref:I78 family peptidase inhibitor n=1 Tax=Aliiroseovarius crassostreae TaxID=154981 RepID=UPI003C7CCECB
MEQKILHIFLALACMGVAGCQSDAAAPPLVQNCPAPGMAHLMGKDVSAYEALRYQGPARVVRPDQAVTMDYRADRLTVTLDDRDRIIGLTCN